MGKEDPALICIIGVDGVGKTTHAQKLLNRLKSNGVRCMYTWFRFYHYLSLFLLGYCRLAGLTIYETRDGHRIGRHEFYRSKVISFLYPWVLFIDMLPQYFVKIFLPLRFGYTVVCDRFIYDTLVDLMMDLWDFDIRKKSIGMLFIRLIPRNTKAVLLDLNETIIRRRRKDFVADQFLDVRKKAYVQIAEDFNMPLIENNITIEGVHEEIVKYLWVNE